MFNIGSKVYLSNDPLKRAGVVMARTNEDYVVQYPEGREVYLIEVPLKFVEGDRSNPDWWDEVANDYELIVRNDLFELAESIRKEGLLNPIILDGGTGEEPATGHIVDGRNRLLASNLAGLELTSDHFVVRQFASLKQKEAFVDALNEHRRHLTIAQKAAKAVRRKARHQVEAKRNQQLGGQLKGQSRLTEASPQVRDKVAAEVGVSSGYVHKAQKILDKSPEVFEKLQRGELTIPEAERLVFPKAEKEPLPVDEKNLDWCVCFPKVYRKEFERWAKEKDIRWYRS